MFLSSADFLKINTFEKFFQEHHQCQTVWIQIRPDVLLGLIWVQTVCKCYQQMALQGIMLKKLKNHVFVGLILKYFVSAFLDFWSI